ncbi:MAG: hypothetical protein J6T81_06110 [Bacteroidales bacterium]|nr:hypothetical protein [Bacteroidales bacterium]
MTPIRCHQSIVILKGRALSFRVTTAARRLASNHWSVCRYSGNNAWNYNNNGIVNNNNFYNSFRVLVVSESVKTK